MERQRRISQSSAVVAALALLLGSAGLLAGRAWAAPQYTKQFALDECSWSPTGRNQYFSIRPGDWLLLEGEDDGEEVRVQIKVLNQTKRITFTDDEGESLTVLRTGGRGAGVEGRPAGRGLPKLLRAMCPDE